MDSELIGILVLLGFTWSKPMLFIYCLIIKVAYELLV